MPVYEFECKACALKFEERMTLDEDSSSAECPRCKERALKVPSLSSFHLKGSGWYKDGYDKTNRKPQQKDK